MSERFLKYETTNKDLPVDERGVLTGNGGSYTWDDLKHKPFGETHYEQVLEEITYDFSSTSPTTLEGYESFELILGETYKVVWDGEEYLCECFSNSGPTIGDVSMFMGGEPTVNAPFCIKNGMACPSSVGTHTFTVYKVITTTLDEKYLPKSVIYFNNYKQNRENALLLESYFKEGKTLMYAGSNGVSNIIACKRKYDDTLGKNVVMFGYYNCENDGMMTIMSIKID